MDMFKALDMAIKAEINAQEMYDRLAEETSDADVRALFSYLAEFETMHQQFLEAERKSLLAAREDQQGRPSHWLKLLREKLNANAATEGSELEQTKLDLSAAEGIAKILKNANEELSQRQARYEQELAIAADIQSKLFPQELPQNPDFQMAASNIMARSVGGDFYDLMANKKGQLALVVADSMGKGMPAALLMTTVRAIWRSCSTSDVSSPGHALEAINRAAYPDLKAAEAFVTVFAAMYDPVTSLFQYSNAGHNPPIFRPESAPECRELDVGSTPIGLFPDTSFPGSEFLMQEGDVIVIYTDGVVEATDSNNKLFGDEKLCSIIEQNHESDAEDIKNAILSEVDSYTGGAPQTDDITLLVLKKT